MLAELLIFAQSIIKRLQNSLFVRNVAMVGGGIAAGLVISFVFMPLLTRLYGPEAFGVAAAFAAIVSIVTTLATLGYGHAIVMPDSDEDAAAVARLSVLSGLVVAVLLLLVVHCGKPWIASWIGMEQTSYMLYLLPVSLLVSTFLAVAHQSAIRASLFKAKARAYVESVLAVNILKLIGGAIAPSGLLLIVFTLSGQTINFVMQILRVPRRGALKPKNWFGFNGVRTAALVHKDFAIYRLPQSALQAASAGLPTVLLASMFGAAAAGQYSLAALALSAPVMLLGQSVGDVFYPKITRAISTQSPDALGLLLKATAGLLILAVIPFGAIILYGEYFFALIFGQEWFLAGQYSQWLALWLLTALVSGASVAALPALRLQRFFLIREVVSLGLRAGALYVGFSVFQSDIVAVALYSVVSVFICLSIIYVTHRRLLIDSKKWQVEIEN